MNNSFDTTVDTDTELTAGEEVGCKIIGEMSKGDSADEASEAGADADRSKFEGVSRGFVKS